MGESECLGGGLLRIITLSPSFSSKWLVRSKESRLLLVMKRWELGRSENLKNMSRDKFMHLAEGWISYNFSNPFFFILKNSTVFHDLVKKKR